MRALAPVPALLSEVKGNVLASLKEDGQYAKKKGEGRMFLVQMRIFVHLFGGQRSFVHLSPAICDVCEHEGDDERYVSHCLQREVARATVAQRERALQIA